MAGSGQEAFPEGQQWSGGLPRGPGVVRKPLQRAGSGLRQFRRVGSGLEVITVGRKAFPKGRRWSESPPGVSGVVGRPFRRICSGQEAILEGQE